MRAGVLGIALLAACVSGPTAPSQLPQYAVAFEPPPGYADLFADVERCADVYGVFGRIHWFQVAGAHVGGGPIGIFLTPDTIIVAADQIWNPGDGYRTPRHEMLHFLLGGDGNHQATAWITCRLMR